MQKFTLLVVLLEILLQGVFPLPVTSRPLFNKLQDRLAEVTDQSAKFLPKSLPGLLQINIKGFKSEGDDEMSPSSKQIPIISDIERIKKVVEILEFVGERVGALLQNLPIPEQLTLSADGANEKRIVKNGTEIIFKDDDQTTRETTAVVV